mmetsp:Transcript_16393/g.24700  ORF Transcript_16393/g.24700 Transcript_16393/m.24700 type:complete len:553 (+) Transcript_16393:101-1759(+)
MSMKYEQMKAVIKAAKIRWLTVDECVDILLNYRSHGFPLSSSPAIRPSPSGSVFLYNATTAADWYEDGYSWKNVGPGGFSKIDVRGIGELVCAANEHQNGFQRRGYWLGQQPSIVLVHYLAEKGEPDNRIEMFGGYERSSNTTDFSARRGGVGMDPRSANMAYQDEAVKRRRLNENMYDAMGSSYVQMSGGARDTKKVVEDKNAKRKARKAEVARACRRRKKAYIQSLEEKAARLAAKLQSMTKTQNGEAAHRKDQDVLIALIRDAVNEGQRDRQIQNLIDRFVHNSRKRQRTDSETYLNRVVDAMTPGDQSKLVLWSIEQGKKVFLGSRFAPLMERMKLSSQQVDMLISKQKMVQKHHHSLNQILGMIDNTRMAIMEHLTERQGIVDDCMKLLTSRQMATMISWVKENPESMRPVFGDWENLLSSKQQQRHARPLPTAPSTSASLAPAMAPVQGDATTNSEAYKGYSVMQGTTRPPDFKTERKGDGGVKKYPGYPEGIVKGSSMPFVSSFRSLPQPAREVPTLSPEAAHLSISDMPSGHNVELLPLAEPSL